MIETIPRGTRNLSALSYQIRVEIITDPLVRIFSVLSFVSTQCFPINSGYKFVSDPSNSVQFRVILWHHNATNNVMT